jgi:hypothetical protein
MLNQSDFRQPFRKRGLTPTLQIERGALCRLSAGQTGPRPFGAPARPSSGKEEAFRCDLWRQRHGQNHDHEAIP